jgi:pyruvate dehydrogenase complex dehydrogenase (E1) component
MTLSAGELKLIECKLLWFSARMIHNANHLRPKTDGIRVGGHQASCASKVTLMTAVYGAILRPEDRVAVKPHAGPVFHAFQYLYGKADLARMQNFRGFGGVQSYPSRTKDVDDVDFSTGSVDLGVAVTAFAAIVRDYVRAKDWSTVPDGRMVALVGDAELDEGIIAYRGNVATEAIAAAALLADGWRDVGILAVTSADRLNAGWQAAHTARIKGRVMEAHVEQLLAGIPRDAPMVTVIDGHPATLCWLGSVHGHRAAGLGVEHFGQTGTVGDLYRHFGVDRNSILKVIASLKKGRTLRAVGWE